MLTRIIAKVRALLPSHWTGEAGKRFRDTIYEMTGSTDLTPTALEGVKRLAVGAASQQHAAAVKNYAEEEQARVNAELARRTLEARQRQENAKADQEETRARMMRSEELLGRLRLFDELQRMNALLILDKDGNYQVVHPPDSFDWNDARTRLFKPAELLVGATAKADLADE